MALNLEDIFKISAVVGVLIIMGIMLILSLPSDNSKSLVQIYIMDFIDECKLTAQQEVNECIDEKILNLKSFYESNYKSKNLKIILINEEDEILKYYELNPNEQSNINSLTYQTSKLNSCNYISNCNYVSYQNEEFNFFSIVII